MKISPQDDKCWAEEMAQRMKGLWCKREDLSSDPQNRCKAGCGGTCLQSQHPMLGIGVYTAESTQQSPWKLGARESGILAEQLSWLDSLLL